MNTFRIMLLALVMGLILGGTGWAAMQPDDQATSGPVRVTPILKAKPQRATVRPIIKGETAPAAPAPDTEPTQAPTPLKLSVKPIKAGEPTPGPTAVPDESAPATAAPEKPAESANAKPEPTPAEVRPRKRTRPAATGEPVRPATKVVPFTQSAPAAMPPGATPTAISSAVTSAPTTDTQIAKPAAQEPAKPPVETAKAKPSGTSSPAVDEAFRTLMEAPPTAEAVADLSRLVNENPAHPLAGPALVRAGEICLKLNLPDKAVIAYKNASMAARDDKVRKQAGEGLARAAASAGDFKQAAARLTELRKSLAEAAADPGVMKSEGLALAAAADYSGAGALLQQVDGVALSDPVAPAKAQALLGQALVAELQGRRDQARQALGRVIKEYAGTNEAALARKRLADLETPLAP